jgi:hypothetical protein
MTLEIFAQVFSGALPLPDALTVIFNMVNVVLILVLVVIYAKNFQAIRSNFTIGLLIFALAFLLQNISNLFWISRLLTSGDFNLTMFQLTANFVQIVAFIILVRLSLK